jgi:Holliday junction resolvase RusA-like endonuclease
MITFTIPGEPQGKGRPRFTRFGKPYTPKQTTVYERAVKYYFRMAYKGERMLGPMAVKITAVLGVPLRGSKLENGRKLAGIIRPTKKPDADNIGKIICDSLNGMAWRDDAQVVKLAVVKQYGAEPRVIVELNQLP